MSRLPPRPTLFPYTTLFRSQDALGHVDLVRQLLDGVGVERDQPVETGNERNPLRLPPQLVPGAIGGWLLELFDEQRERTLVDRPGVVGKRVGVGQRHAAPLESGVAI